VRPLIGTDVVDLSCFTSHEESTVLCVVSIYY
jgi:hypothetical protein